jgi:peptidylprolyl isomerase
MKKLAGLVCLGGLLLAAGCGESDPYEGKATATESGLKYYDIQPGDGEEAKPLTVAELHYIGKLRDGTKFDSSRDRKEPFHFVVGAGEVIKGWDEGVRGMKEGGKRRLYIPAKLAYGNHSPDPARIPQDSDLVFDVELLKVQPGPEIEDLKVGDGAEAKRGNVVQVLYTGRLDNGTVFDSSAKHDNKPMTFPLGGGKVIGGWDVGIPGMKVGGKRKLVIPPYLAYGPRGTPDGAIPPNATLTFEVELLKIVK